MKKAGSTRSIFFCKRVARRPSGRESWAWQSVSSGGTGLSAALCVGGGESWEIGEYSDAFGGGNHSCSMQAKMATMAAPQGIHGAMSVVTAEKSDPTISEM